MNINLRKLGLLLVCLFSAFSVMAQTGEEKTQLFEYPEIPDRLTKPELRADYMVLHLWDKCNLEKETITDFDAFHEAFTDYLSFFVIANKDEVEKSIKQFVRRIAKNEGNLRLLLTVLNEEVLSPYGNYVSDEVYSMFAMNLADEKKVDKELRRVMEYNVEIINANAVGAVFPDLPVAIVGAGETSIHQLASELTVVVVNTESASDTSIFKLRLGTDIATNALIGAGLVTVVSVYDKDSAAAESQIASETKGWAVAKVEKPGDRFDMRVTPTVYLLDRDHKIVKKYVQIDEVLAIMASLKSQKGI